MSASLPRPSLDLRALAGPLTLLTALTSLAFNRASLARDERETQRVHRAQVALLREEVARARAQSQAARQGASWWSRSTAKAKGKARQADADADAGPGRDVADLRLVRRCVALGLDPARLGLGPGGTSPLDGAHPPGQTTEITWRQVLFGLKPATGSGAAAGQTIWEKIQRGVAEAGQGVRVAMGGAAGAKTAGRGAGPSAEEDDEWEKAILELARKEGLSLSLSQSNAEAARPAQAASATPNETQQEQTQPGTRALNSSSWSWSSLLPWRPSSQTSDDSSHSQQSPTAQADAEDAQPDTVRRIRKRNFIV